MEKTTGKYFTMTIQDGIIKCYPAAPEYYQVGETVANSLAESVTSEWRKICLSVMDAMAEQADLIKSKIVSDVSFRIYPKSMEVVKNRSFEQSKNYIEGYSDAVSDFSNAFKSVEGSLEHAIEKVLPSFNSR